MMKNKISFKNMIMLSKMAILKWNSSKAVGYVAGIVVRKEFPRLYVVSTSVRQDNLITYYNLKTTSL